MGKYMRMPKLPENLQRMLIDDLKQKVGDYQPAKYAREVLGLTDNEIISKLATYIAKTLRGQTEPSDLKHLAYVADLEILDVCARFYLRRWEYMNAKTEEVLLELADFSNMTEEERAFNNASKQTVYERAWEIGV